MAKIEDYNFKGKKAIVRVDFNVPLDENGKITDDTRIRGALPTLKKILGDGGALILMSHMGKPKGKVNPKMSLSQIREAVAKALDTEVEFAPDCAKAQEQAKNLKPGQVLLLENLRFYPEGRGKPVGIDKNDPAYDAAKKEIKERQKEFAKTLADYADVYVNDAFGTAHRRHASTAVLPFGGMTFTFAKARGGHIGNSIVEDDKLQLALDIIEMAKKKGVNLVLGTDCVAGNKFSNDSDTQICSVMDIPEGWEGMDAGPESIKAFRAAILPAKTILWNGPAGVFEFDKFTGGSRAIADAIVEATENGAFSLVGGGDSVACINKFGLADKVSYVSTGGGALLEAIEGKLLPGVAAVKG